MIIYHFMCAYAVSQHCGFPVSVRMRQKSRGSENKKKSPKTTVKYSQCRNTLTAETHDDRLTYVLKDLCPVFIKK